MKEEIYLSPWFKHHMFSSNENLSDASDKFLKFTYHTFILNMNKKHFTEFWNYLEGFTQRTMTRFPDSKDFINDEKKQLASVQPKSKASHISVIEYTLTSSLKKRKTKKLLGCWRWNKKRTPEECVDSVNLLSKAIGNAHKDVLFYSALQGDLLSSLKDVCCSSFPLILWKNINISRSHAFFLMKFHRLILDYPKLLHCDLPVNFSQKNFQQ